MASVLTAALCGVRRAIKRHDAGSVSAHTHRVELVGDAGVDEGLVGVQAGLDGAAELVDDRLGASLFERVER